MDPARVQAIIEDGVDEALALLPPLAVAMPEVREQVRRLVAAEVLRSLRAAAQPLRLEPQPR